ncbi:HAD-superfamily hydrolase, subfamily IA, variant 1 [Vibrio nigripulchritudo ATCC 27043]|uniref:HAD family hydrolase n=1 Tax=Vibrio nigripulchritudo TaxID=28173 RepID=UPI00021C3BBB|nr:HAD hydrolase-like protein [Vibrio nigripulchritudo]EGU54993.1 HAD-superfamily hydrolase, subfamily IA, variant 1 [Vibrio nigripulchritudo ATCC 27043]CCN36388.1 putative phosphatase [Vibrio nigripulchritudo AM115]CCN40679.1 putative phosphatase [Vibrio nigripulchritudo FTn2]CCN64514.1 putative phosphatase [Vibrio nigripulchritudo POn4]CCN69606.1 putative phosphatase [Vibrio nigripulchritudo SFn118]
MDYQTIIFDLDGTIIEPRQGFIRSINYSLQAHNFPSYPEQQLINYIGPPLDLTFYDITKQNDPKLIQSLVDKYRERYSEVGYKENSLYSGITHALKTLHQSQQFSIGLCTSKRADYASQILELHGIRDLFDFVDGADIGTEKWQQLEALKAKGIISEKSLMVGDRAVDLTAAHKNGLKSAGVLWGYGSKQELTAENPAHLWSKPEDILKLLEHKCSGCH